MCYWAGGGGWWFLWPLWFFGFWIVLALIFRFAFWRRRAHWHGGPGGHMHGGPPWAATRPAEQVLGERYARGEITEQEYRERLTVLRTPQ